MSRAYIPAFLAITTLLAGCPDSSGSRKARLSLQSVTPAVGSQTGGETITLTGSGFKDGMQVVFGISPALSVTVLSGKEATAITPFSPIEVIVDVSVILPSGRTRTLVDAFTYDGSCLTGCPGCIANSIDPVEGPRSGGSTVRIRGAGFGGGSFVTFASTLAPLTDVQSSTEILAVTPSSPLEGWVDVAVSNATGDVICRIPDGFHYGSGCSVLSATPTDVCGWISETVVISGDGFESGAEVSFVPFSGPATTPLETTVLDSMTIEAKVPTTIGDGPHEVIVTNPGGATCFQAAGINVVRGLNPSCSITDISPSTGPIAGGDTVTITGGSFPGNPRVFFGDNEATVIAGGLNVIEVESPPGARTGLVLVNVVDPACTGVPCTGTYSYN